MENIPLKLCISCGTLRGPEVEVCPVCEKGEYRQPTLGELKERAEKDGRIRAYFKSTPPAWPPNRPEAWEFIYGKENLEEDSPR